MDLITPMGSMPPGRVIASLNYEPVAAGYRRLRGFERFDGRTAPSAGGDRALITAVPGEGPVRGVWLYNGQVLAFRNVAEPSNFLKIWKATAAGWVEVSFGYWLTLQYLVGEVFPGNVVTSTSGGSGTVVLVSKKNGSWTGGTIDDVALLTFDSYTGTFIPGDEIFVGGVKVGSIPPTAAVGIRAGNYPDDGDYFKFINYNFLGSGDPKMYFISGQDPIYEYNGTHLVPVWLLDGNLQEVWPTAMAIHRNALCASEGPMLYISVPGDPHNWSGADGAAQIGLGDNIVDLISMPNSLAILCEHSIHILYGNDAADYQLETLTREAGALAFTAQRAGGDLLYMDNRGLRTLSASRDYGNFAMGTVSQFIATLLEDKRRDGIPPVASLISRTTDQYWVFFSDGTGMVAYLGAKPIQFMPFNLGKVAKFAVSVEENGEERLLIGAEDGFVYELNKGTSFDGAAIEHYVRLPFNHFGQPMLEKTLHRVTVDLEASGTTSITLDMDYDYGAVPGSPEHLATVTSGGAAIDSLGTNELYFASQIETQAVAYIDGYAKNFSLKVKGSTSTEEPHTLTGVTFHITPGAVSP